MQKKWDQSGWIRGIRHYPSPNFNERPQGCPIDLVVIHSISLPPDDFSSDDVIDFFQNKLDCTKSPFYQNLIGVKVSAHFFIKRDGEMIQFVSTIDRAWHAGVSAFDGRDNCNDYSIGIELEGCDTMPFEKPQYQALSELLQMIMDAYPQVTQARVVSHAEIALPPGRKTDPGPYFDWNNLWSIDAKR
jgi:AmpD protein